MRATIANNHLPGLLVAFLEMVKQGEHCNVNLQCQNGTVKVPGLILASISPLIRELGTTMPLEPEFSIILPDFTANNISDFVRKLLTPSLNKEIDHTFNHIFSFFQNCTTIQEESFQDLTFGHQSSFEDIDQVINAVSQEDGVIGNDLPIFEEDEGVETELNVASESESDEAVMVDQRKPKAAQRPNM